MRTSPLRWELLGIPLIFFCGSALHFAFEWSGRLPVVAPFAAVNETVNFAIAKAVGIFLMPLLIVLLFYGYTALVGHHILWLDILIFFIAVAAGQLASYGLLRAEWPSGRWDTVGLAAVVLLAVGFALFTFATPRLAIFRDSTTGAYGVGR